MVGFRRTLGWSGNALEAVSSPDRTLIWKTPASNISRGAMRSVSWDCQVARTKKKSHQVKGFLYIDT